MPPRKPPEKVARRKPFVELLETTHEHQSPRDLNFARAFVEKAMITLRKGLRKEAAIACLILLNAKDYKNAWKAFERLKKIEAATIGRADHTEGTSERIHPMTENLFGAIAALKTRRHEEFWKLINAVFEFLPKEPRTDADREALNEILDLANEHGVYGEVNTAHNAWLQRHKT